MVSSLEINSTDKLIKYIEETNNNEPLFCNLVKETFRSIKNYLDSNPISLKAALNLIEPERIVSI